MKTVANFLILCGSGLAAWGVAGFSGSFDFQSVRDPSYYYGWAGWPLNSQAEIVLGVVALILGVLIRKDSK